MNRFKNKSQFWPQMTRLALVAIAYWVAVRIGLLFVAQPEGVASIWPASGLALAILLLSPKDQWAKLLAVIFVTNAAGNLSGGDTLPVSLGFALANMLEAFLGAWALIYFCKSRITFGRTAEVFALFGVATLGNGITALLGAAIPVLARGTPFMNTWLIWWISAGLGMALVTPLIVTWATRQNMLQSPSPRRVVEAVLLVLALTAFSWLLFGPFTVAEDPVLRNYMVFPILIWLAFRYSPLGMASALILFAAIAIWNTLQGYGIFAFTDQTVTEHLVSVQIFLSVMAFSGLLLSAIVTERKRAEEALQRSAIDLKEAQRVSRLGSWDWDAVRDTITWSEEYCHIYGFDPKLPPPSYEEHLKVYTPESAAQLDAAVKHSMQTGEEYELDLEEVRADGTQRWFTACGEVKLDANGQIVGLRGTAQDITERKRAEDALRESEEKWHSFVSASPDYIALHDRNGRYLFLNHYAEGFTERDVIRSSVFEYLAPESKDLFRMKTEECLNTLTTQKFEYSAMGDYGTFKTYEQYLVPITNAKKEMEILAIARDITEREQAEQTLEAVNIELQAAIIREQQLARTDALTGVNNRRSLYELAGHEFYVAIRYQQPLSVIMFDIDHFKKVNDTFGHMAGDQILERITQVACAELRSADVIGRYGGEEFIIVLPMTNAHQAYSLAERIRMEVEALRVPTPKGDASVTLSFGIVEMLHTSPGDSVEDMFRRADMAMYAAKQAGRNRTMISNLE